MNQPFSLFLSRVVASLLAMAVAISAMGLFLIWAARSVDREDIRRQGEIAGYALSEVRSNLSHNQESSTFWDEAVERTTAGGNEEWIDGNLGSWMHTFFGFDEAYVLDGQDKPIYSFAEEQRKPAIFFEERRDLLRPYLKALRSKLATGETPVEGSHEQSVGVSDYIYIAGHPAALSVKPIVSDSGRLNQPLSTIHVHVAIQYLEGAVIRRVGQAHVLQDLKFVPADERNSDAGSVSLTSDAGDVAIAYEWAPLSTGSAPSGVPLTHFGSRWLGAHGRHPAYLVGLLSTQAGPDQEQRAHPISRFA